MILNSEIIFGMLAGILVCGMLYVPLISSFGYSVLVAGIIVTTLILLICIGLAISVHCRCIMSLVFPSFFTGKGRGVILSVIFGVLLTGSVLHNIRETGRSMACFIHLLANQTDTFQMPVNNIKNSVTQQSVEQTPLNNVHDGFAALKSLLPEFEKELCGINDMKTDHTQKECKIMVEHLAKHCESTFNNTNNRHNNNCPEEECMYQCCNNLTTQLCPLRRVGYDFEHIRSYLDKVEGIYKGDIRMHFEEQLTSPDGLANAIKSVDVNVNADLNSKKNDFEAFIHILQKILSLYLPLVFLKAYWYFKDYLSKDWYDNYYITKQFIELDTLFVEANGNGVLPLKKREKKKYIYTLSLKLNKKEMKHCKKGLIQVFLHFLICSLILWLDYADYYLLNLVRKVGESEIILFRRFQGGFNFTVRGDGPIAAFYRRFMNVQNIFLTDQTIEKCLPSPLFYSVEQIAVVMFLYVIALCFVLLRGYGMRLRRKIAAYYYPEQEDARMEYLHKAIQHERSAHKRFLRQQVMSTYKEKNIRGNFRLSSRVLQRFPGIAKYAPKQNRLECISCEVRQGILISEFTKCSGVKDGIVCCAVYCEECWLVLKGVCPLCSSVTDTL